jgi:hypothetical protein
VAVCRDLSSFLAGVLGYGESSTKFKDIYAFFNKFDFLELRPLQILLLVHRVYVASAGEGHGAWRETEEKQRAKGEGEKKARRGTKDQAHFLPTALLAAVDATLVKPQREKDAASRPHFPNISIATLLLAGRFLVEDWGPVSEANHHSLSRSRGLMKTALEEQAKRHEQEMKTALQEQAKRLRRQPKASNQRSNQVKSNRGSNRAHRE